MIFWDLDGPIVDVSDKYYAVYRDILSENGMQFLPQKEYWKHKKTGAQLNEILSKTNSEKLVNIFKELWLTRIETPKYQVLDNLQPGIIKVLNQCNKNNNSVLVTLRRNRQRLLEQLDDLYISNFFEAILNSGGDIKPRWKIKYNLINEYLNGNIKENHVIIGDTETDILAGKNLGLNSVGVLCGIRGKQLINSKPDKLFKQSIGLLELFG